MQGARPFGILNVDVTKNGPRKQSVNDIKTNLHKNTVGVYEERENNLTF